MPPSQPPPRQPLEGLRILLADDAASFRHLYWTALARAGANVAVAIDGENALLLWKAATGADLTFDLVVLDYSMPGADGAFVTASLRDVGFEGPIIGISAELDEKGARQWLDLGCDEVLEKGISLAEFSNRVAAHARRSAD